MAIDRGRGAALAVLLSAAVLGAPAGAGPAGAELCPVNPSLAPPCPDADGDGLCDAWERSGRLPHGGRLQNADPQRPDVYLQYDWMDYADSATAAACAVDADCAARGPQFVTDRCRSGRCQHTHDPEILAPGALDAVVDRFARRGIRLHLLRGHAVPHSQVLSLRDNEELSLDCEGGSVAAGSAGLGRYAASFSDVKARYFDARLRDAFHYAVFAHYSSCDTASHCNACPAPAGRPEAVPRFGQSGIAELPGNDFIVSLGRLYNDIGVAPHVLNLGGTFMHELGHNLGLRHGGSDDVPNFKPNYLSVMNFQYQFAGILRAEAPGSEVPAACTADGGCLPGEFCRRVGAGGICARLDYSTQRLPVGGPTPGELREDGGLDEFAGLGSGTADLFAFTDASCQFRLGASHGPVDWSGDGVIADTAVSADLNPNDDPANACVNTTQRLAGHADWGMAGEAPLFNFSFRCQDPDGAHGPSRRDRWTRQEADAETAVRMGAGAARR